jgi:hypothetical protein
MNFPFFFKNFSKIKSFLEKLKKKFQSPPPTVEKILKFSSRRRLLDRFLIAVAELQKKFSIFSRRR